MKVDFLIIGAQKGGSTWLYDNLRDHKELCTPGHEVHFFSSDTNYCKGAGWYHNHFSGARVGMLLGEKTPEYLTIIPSVNENTSLETAQRIFDYNPAMKLIVVLREPIARLKSAVNHMIRTRRLSPFITLQGVITGNHKLAGDQFSLLENGLYYDNLRGYLSIFPKNQVRIYFFETDIIKNPLRTLGSVCEHIGVEFREEYFTSWKQKKNEYKMSKPALYLNHYFPGLRFFNNRLNHLFPPYKVKNNSEVITFLESFYKQPNLKLKELTGYIPENWYY